MVFSFLLAIYASLNLYITVFSSIILIYKWKKVKGRIAIYIFIVGLLNFAQLIFEISYLTFWKL